VGGSRPHYSAGRTFNYHGRAYRSVYVPHYHYARGYTYRVFRMHDRFPAFLLISNYFLQDYYLYNLTPPPPGYVWVRFGPDALLVNTYNGDVMDTAPGVFDDSAPPPDDGGDGGPPPPDPGAGADGQAQTDADGTRYPGPNGYPQDGQPPNGV
jgi:Ni/Co efflux regulator RcnB